MKGISVTTQLLSPPTIEPSKDWLEGRRAHLVTLIESASATAVPRPARRRWRVALIAVAVALVATGVALAATGNLLDWLRSSGPGEARYSVDTKRTVTFAAPSDLTCAEPGDGAFECAPGRSGPWTYDLYDRIEAQQAVTRDLLLTRIADLEGQGAVTGEFADRVRREVAAVGDDFFVNISVLQRINSVASPHQVRPGVILVPPSGVPQFVTCEPASAGALECRDLTTSPDLPVGTPIYGLRQNRAWVEQPYRPERPDFLGLVESVFGRPLTAAEERLLITLASAGTTGTGGEDGGTVESATTVGN
jgi:hypothetical protein